ncbi:hypothetical protein [uncultured Paludibaculum sp.]|uniref:hypothetical protein n=1 Tax=uncultured Paludibaculum sp. TaxID=1765020 RepID=UPI002AAB0568|nr:hypothetical protein [uncultured Paludibaculum sp.]
MTERSDPDLTSVTEQLLGPLQPDENALTALFLSEIDATMCREIAEADYSNMADHCYALLDRILATGRVAGGDPSLQEVLELIRWSEPDEPGWRPGGEGPRGHWMRLFACVVLVRLGPVEKTSYGGETDTLAQLVASAIELGPSTARAAAGLLAWRFLADPGDDAHRAFLAFAILLLALHLERGRDHGAWFKRLAKWVEEEEARARNEWSGQEWLIGVAGYCQKDAVWRSLAKRLLAAPARPHPREADEELRLLGLLVAGG